MKIIILLFCFLLPSCQTVIDEIKKRLPEIPGMPLPEPPPPVEPPKEKPAATCVKKGLSFDKNGPYQVRQRRSGGIVIYEPAVSGCKMPVYNHCNGTGAMTIYYRTQLQRMASHGYLAVAYETRNSGSGREAMRAIEYGLSRSDTVNLLVTGGHSQGGQCAASSHFLAQQKYGDSLKIVSVNEEPAWGMSRPGYAREVASLRGSSFVINGSADTVVNRAWVQRGAKLLRNDRYWYTAVGATHFNVQSWAATSTLAFANWKLLSYSDAESYFLRLPSSRYWSKVW